VYLLDTDILIDVQRGLLPCRPLVDKMMPGLKTEQPYKK
jgi:hypothetical protein